MAVNLPKAGEINLMRIPDIKYQTKTEAGPYHPTSYDRFRENRIMSRVGFEKSE